MTKLIIVSFIWNWILFTFLILCISDLVASSSVSASAGCQSRQCTLSQSETGGDSPFPKYEEGQSYYYEYETESITQLINSENEDQSKVNLKGHVILTPITNCYFDLSVGALKAITWFRGAQANVNTKVDIPKSSLRFFLENGTIGQVCSQTGDSFWSQNIKKSIISLLQITHFGNGVDDFKTTQVQNDISGSCETEVEKVGNLYYKRKNLSKCSHRELGPSFLQGVPYDSHGSKYNGIPLLESKLTCRQEIHSDVIQISVCSEENVLKSFPASGSRSGSGSGSGQNLAPSIKSTLKSSLSLISVRRDFTPQASPSNFTPTTIYFQSGHQEGTAFGVKPDSIQKLTLVLNFLCLEFKAEELSKDAPDHLQRLQGIFVTAPKEDLRQVYEDIKAGHLCREKRTKIERVFLKAAAQLASDGSIGFLAELYTTRDLNDEIAALFFKHASFSRRPGRASLTVLNNLVQSAAAVNEENQMSILLSASALAHQFCKLTNSNCGDVPEYTDLVASLAQLTVARCENPREIPKNMVLALQALGNLDHLTVKGVEAISKCLSVKSSRIKIHAFAAFRRDPCQPFLKAKAKALLSNLRAGSDVRIHAYLALMRCFKPDDLEAIQRVVDVEQSNQVSSFIFSHLKNQLESGSRGKQGLKSLLRKIHIRPQAHGAPGKLSKSLESSWFLQENNVGFSLENNLVYSQDSYIPRTVSFNCTLDLLGRSYNFFEVGVYVENFENLLTRFYTDKVRFQTPSSEQNLPNANAAALSETGTGDQAEDALDIDIDFDPYLDSDNNIENINNEISKSQNNSTQQNSNNTSNSNKAVRNYIIKPADVEFIENQVQIENRYGDNGEFDIFTRHHGTTISMSSMTQNDIPNLGEVPSILMAQKESLINFFKDQIIEKTRPINFIDEHIMIATSNGLPLNLKLHSSALFSSKYEINMDIPALFSRSGPGTNRNGSSSQVEEMHLRLMPNIAASINARMSVGPELFEAGYQLEGKLHLSAAADFSLENKMEHLKVNYNFPLNRFRVFEFDTQLVWVQEVNGLVSKRVEIQSKSPTQMLVNDCSTDSSRLFGFISPHQFGVRYCYNIRLPRGISFQNFWLQGPMSFRISSEKLDETMRGFSLDIYDVHNNVDAEGKSATVIVLDASGEETSRKITLISNFTDSPGSYGNNVLEQFSASVEFPEAPLTFIAQIHDTNDDDASKTIQGITATLAMERQGSLSECEYKIILKTTKDGSFSEDGAPNNSNQIITYEPIISKRVLNSNTAAKHFLQGKLVRQVGASLDFDVSVRLDSEALNLNSMDAKGLILANRSTGGNFEFQIKNGKLNIANSENNVMTTEFAGKIFNENPNMGFELESVLKTEGTHQNENGQELDFKISSSTSFVPAKKFSFETKVVSRKQPELNTDFKFLAELVKANVSKPGGSGASAGAGGTAGEFEIESQIWIATHFNRWWDIEAVRRAGSTYGSLELTVNIPALRRKLVLYTHRDHVDLENFTKFDFDAFLKWNAGRDDKMKMAVKLNFVKNDTSPAESSIIKSNNEIAFINQIHVIKLNSKIPKNYKNGEYLIEADYTSPSGTNYGINYQKSIVSNPRNSNYNNLSSEINVSVNIPQYPTIKGYWKHSLYLAKNANLWNKDYEFKSDLSVVAGRDTFFECVLNAAERFPSGDREVFSIENEFKFGGHFVPLQLHTFTKFDRVENGTIDLEFKLVRDYKRGGDDDNNPNENRGPRMRVGEKGGQLIFKFTPEVLVTSAEMLYRVELGWEPTRNHGGEYFILVPAKLSYTATASMVSLFDFKIKNHAVLTLPSGETSFIKNIEFSNNALSIKTSLQTLNPDNILDSLDLNGALRKDGVGTFKLSTHTPSLGVSDAQLIVKLDLGNPQNYLNVSVNSGDDTLFTLDHQVTRPAPNRAAQSQRISSQSRTFLQVNFNNTILDGVFEENQITILHQVIWGQDRASFSIDYNLVGTKLRAKAGLLKDTDITPDSQNDKNQWFIILGYELQESRQNNYDSYKIRFEGPISYNMETSAFKGIVLLEEFTYAHEDLAIEHSVTKIDGSLSSGIGGLGLPTITSLYLNSTWFSAEETYFKYDKFQEYFDSPNSVFQIDKELTETFIESLLTEPSGSNFIKYDYNVSHMTSTGSDVYCRLQLESFYPIGLPYMDFNLHLITHEYALQKLTVLMLTNEELGQDDEIDYYSEGQSEGQGQGQGQGKGQIMTGWQWINTNSLHGEKYTSFCLIDEITLLPYPDPIQTEFQNCYTGFVLNRTMTNEGAPSEEKILNAKFSFKGDIAFEAVKFERLHLVEFNSSLWLDALDKPDEKLELSLLRKTVVEVESDAQNSVPNKLGREYLVAIKHPFLPKDLQVKAEFSREDTGKAPILNVTVILDIFQENAQNIAFNYQRKPQETGKENLDVEFEEYKTEYDLDERISTVTSTAAVPEIFEISLVSEGLDLNMKLEGNIDLSDLSYNYVDRYGQLNGGKILFRTFSLLDSTVAQIGELPFITVSFGGVPRLEISTPNSQNKSLIIEYHGSPTSLRIFTSESPEDSYYSVVIPPRNEDEFTIGIYSQNNSEDDISNGKVINLDLALNTSNFFQLQSQWDIQQIQYTLIDLRSLRKGIATSIKTYLVSATNEITANIKSYSSKIYNNIPDTQKMLGKLATELQNIYDDAIWGTISDTVRRVLSIGESTAAFDFNETAFSSFLQNLGGMSYDDFESNFEAAFQKCQEEGISFILLSVGKIKRCWADSKIFLNQFLRANPGLRNFLETFEEFITAGKTITRNLLRKILYETIKIRPYLRWLIPKEAHEFLITLKNYSLDKLQSDNHIIIQNSIEITNVTSEEVLSKGLDAGKIIGRRFLEGKGFLLLRENESILVQLPLPEPARTIRQVFSKRDKIPKADLHDLHNIYRWITDYDFKIPGMPNILQGINSALNGAVGLVGSTGVIIGGKFYRTFDGKMHRFEGSCQYLLAADFLARNLTVAIDTDESNGSEERRLVLMHNGETIVIYPNTSVEYEGHREEVSVINDFADFETTNLGPFRTYRQYFPLLGNGVSVFTRNSGLTVTCLSTFHICFVRLEGHLYGKSLGLLGSNNLEHYDDFSVPNGEIVGKTGRFYRSWRLNRECKETRGNLLVADESDREEIKARCADIFQKDTSPLRSCFNTLNPADFQDLCEALALSPKHEDSSNNSNNNNSTDPSANQLLNTDDKVTMAVCTVASAYYMQCREYWIKVDFPLECLLNQNQVPLSI